MIDIFILSQLYPISSIFHLLKFPTTSLFYLILQLSQFLYANEAKIRTIQHRTYNKMQCIYYNMLSDIDKQFLKKQLNILPNNIEKWTKQEFSRLLALLKFPESIQKQFYDQSLNVTFAKGTEEVIEKLYGIVNETNYFPFQKLKCALSLITNIGEEDSLQYSLISKNLGEANSEISISETAVKYLVQAIDKLVDTFIIELPCSQIYSLTKNCGLDEHAAIIKKYNLDGFNLILSLSDFQISRDIKNYYKNQDIAQILELSYLYLTQYFRQNILQNNKRNALTLSKKNITQTQPFEGGGGKGQLKQFVIESTQMVKKLSEDDIEIDPLEEMDQYGQSIVGNSEMGQSQYASSEKGSVYAESEYANSVRGSVDCRLSYRFLNGDGRASLMYDSEIITQLRDACLYLPFDLLNLEPLQQIKIRALKSAFGKEQNKDIWSFSVQGAKLGRDKENDLRFPDQLSISSKHAQIIFKNQQFFLQDSGSKMGTYLRIMKNFAIEDETYIQFSTEVQILFRILKKSPHQGTIKAEIKKPQNLSDYKISLKEGYKIKIGKSDRCHIRINSSTLADKHSEIFYKDCKFFFKNCHASLVSWLRLSPKSVCSEAFKLNVGDIFRLSSKKSFQVQDITNELTKNLHQPPT